VTVTLSWELAAGSVTVAFVPVRPAGAVPALPPAALVGLTARVRVTVVTARPRCQATAEFAAAEVPGAFAGRWPDDANFDRIRRAVADRKAYPVAIPEPPPERTAAAQGQTRKPGSHGGAQHRRK
jgi:hypothetical protein